MTITAKRTFPFKVLPVDGGSSDYQVTPGMIEAGLIISAPYSANVTAVGTAVRAYSMPIRRVLLKDDLGNILHVWRARDLIAVNQIFEQASLASMLIPPSGFAIANYPNLIAHVPLMFEQTGPKVAQGDKTALPTFAYAPTSLTLTVEWGSVTDLLTGAPTGLVTFNPPSAASGAPVVTQLDYADVKITNGRALASIMPIAVNRYREVVQAAVAADALELDLGVAANIRGIVIVQENASGEPTEAVIDTVTLFEDNSLAPISKIPWQTLKQDNAKHYGVSMPLGYTVIDFAEDGDVDINHIYRARDKNKVVLQFKTEAVIGTIRAALLTIMPPRQF